VNVLEPDEDGALSPQTADAEFDVVVLATSAGGLVVLRQLLSELPANFSAAILVVQHLERHRHSFAAEILDRSTSLFVKEAEAGERLRSARVYVAPPDHHLLVNPAGILSLNQSALVNFTRPAADVLFESVAASYGKRAIAVVLTGTGKDGAAGVRAIKANGGIVIAQEQPEFSGMPRAAIETGVVDFVLPLSKVAPALVQLVEKESIK
jgi:two-component system chemotaxis response regulator CheB